MWMWICIAIISIVAIIADMITKNKKIELKRLEREIELEQSKQALLETKMENKELL